MIKQSEIDALKVTSTTLDGQLAVINDAQIPPLQVTATTLDAQVNALVATIIPPPVPVITQETMNLAHMVVLDAWCQPGARYTRFQTLLVLKGTTATLRFNCTDFTQGGKPIPFGMAAYNLLMDDVVIATRIVSAGSTQSTFAFSLAGIGDGWHKFKIATMGVETSPTCFVYVQKSGTVQPQPFIPVYTGSYDVAHNLVPHSWALLPARFTPTPKPLPSRVIVPFSTALPYTQLHRSNIVPVKKDDLHRPNINVDGVMSTFCRQAYDWSQLIGVKPEQAMLDGSRGMGTIAMPTDIKIDGDDLYVLDSWRLSEIDATGDIVTLFGYRAPGIGSYWQDPSNVELVGDWSAIPIARRGMREAWAVVRDPTSLVERWLVADTQNNRILEAVNTGNDVFALKEFIIGLKDPWGLVVVGGVIYITERLANRISAWNRITGAFLGVILESTVPGLAYLRSDRLPVRVANLTTIQAEPLYMPEALEYQDGKLVFGSMIQGQVRSFDLASKALAVLCSPHIDGNSKFVKLALSDGTFGPRGTIFTWTWSNSDNGYPEAFLPGGAKWTLQNSVHNLSNGRGGSWVPQGYGSSGGVAVGNGKLIMGSSEEGLVRLTQVNADDPIPDYAKYAAGKAEFQQRGFPIEYGEDCYGYQGFAPPFGVSPNIDYYLTWNGH